MAIRKQITNHSYSYFTQFIDMQKEQTSRSDCSRMTKSANGRTHFTVARLCASECGRERARESQSQVYTGTTARRLRCGRDER